MCLHMKKEEGFEIIDKLPTPQEVFKIPEKPSIRQWLFTVFGPAMIVLGVGIGGGEILTGPVAFARWGMWIFYFTIITIVLQAIYNMYCLHWTVAVGEPTLVGLRRIFIAAPYIVIILSFLWVGFPGWISAAATSIAWLQLGRIPTAADFWSVTYPWAAFLIILAVVIVSIGGKIERTLEILQWVLVVLVFSFLIVLISLLTPIDIWIESLEGMTIKIGYLPADIDWFTLGAYINAPAFAAGFNLFIMHWYRDKGYGMSSLVGYIPGLIKGKKVALSPEGKIATPNDQNISTFKRWIRIGWAETILIFAIGNIFGMLLPSLLWRSTLPLGTKVSGFGPLGEISQAVAAKLGVAFGIMIAIVAFLILFTTFIGILDMLSRIITDTIWSTSKRVSQRLGDVRKLYYIILGLYVAWALYALTITAPLLLIQLSFNSIALATVIIVPLVMWLIRTKLPKAYRPSLWMDIVLILMVIFYGWVFYNVLYYQLTVPFKWDPAQASLFANVVAVLFGIYLVGILTVIAIKNLKKK